MGDSVVGPRTAAAVGHKAANHRSLLLKITSGRSLVLDDVGVEQPNVYATASLGKQTGSSEPLPWTPDPVWESEVNFHYTTLSDIVKVKVYINLPTQNTTTLIGKVKIRLTTVLNNCKLYQGWFSLMPGSGFTLGRRRELGSIHLCFVDETPGPPLMVSSLFRSSSAPPLPQFTEQDFALLSLPPTPAMSVGVGNDCDDGTPATVSLESSEDAKPQLTLMDQIRERAFPFASRVSMPDVPSLPWRAQPSKSPTATTGHALRVTVVEGRNLRAMDSNGYSDPYVVLRLSVGGQTYRTAAINRTLNPQWELSGTQNQFTMDLPVGFKEGVLLKVVVMDKDFVMDDFLGQAMVDLSTLSDEEEQDIWVTLDPQNESDHDGMPWGEIRLRLQLQTASEMANNSKKSFRKLSTVRISGEPNPLFEVEVVAITARKLVYTSSSKGQPTRPSLFCVFSLDDSRSTTKAKTHTVLSRCPRWLHQRFVLRGWDTQCNVKVKVTNGNTLVGAGTVVGRALVSVDTVRHTPVFDDWLALTHPKSQAAVGQLHVLMRYRDFLGPPFPPLPDDFDVICVEDCDRVEALESGAASAAVVRDKEEKPAPTIARLRVKVVEANNLPALDVGGNSDPYCVLSLQNYEVATFVQFKTLNAVWNQTFAFTITEPMAVLRVKVMDYDRMLKHDVIGHVTIPLTSLYAGKQRVTFKLHRKLSKEGTAVSSSQPMDSKYLQKENFLQNDGTISLELHYTVDKHAFYKAFLLSSPEHSLFGEQKFSPEQLKHNIMRVVNGFTWLGLLVAPLSGLTAWTRPVESMFALLLHTLVCLYLWDYLPAILPPLFALLVLWAAKSTTAAHGLFSATVEREEEAEDNRSILAKYQDIKQTVAGIQNTANNAACMLEKMQNVLSWRHKELTRVAASLLLALGILVGLLLYCVPARYIVLVIGVVVLRPWFLKSPSMSPPQRVLYNLLVRVPTHTELRRDYNVDK